MAEKKATKAKGKKTGIKPKAKKKEEIPVEETPVEETLVEETPVEETLVEETLVEETPVEETLVEETLVEETLVEETLVEETKPKPGKLLGFEFTQEVLSFDQIEKHDKFPNCRQTYPGIEELGASIFETGLQNPLTVWEFVLDKSVKMPWGIVDKRYFIIAGFRRRQAIAQLQIEHPEFLSDIPVHVFRGKLKDAIFLNLTENVQREDPNTVELGTIFADLVDNHGMMQMDVANRLGKSETYVSLVLKFHRNKEIAPQLREMVASNQLNAWMAMEIAKKEPSRQIQIVERLADAFEDGTSEKKIKEIKKELDDERPTPKKKIRSHKEVLERFDKGLVSNLDKMSEEDKVHMSGILKGMYWMLNNDVDWDDLSLYGWGLSESAMEEAEAREGKRSKKKKKD